MRTEKHKETDENVTKYGEFVCSCYKWLPLEKQKEKAQRLENVTKKRKK